MGLIRLVIFALAALAAYMLFRRLTARGRPLRDDTMEDERLGRLVQDPNCGVYVDSKEAVRRSVPDGDLFFCSKDCADTYLEKAREGG